MHLGANPCFPRAAGAKGRYAAFGIERRFEVRDPQYILSKIFPHMLVVEWKSSTLSVRPDQVLVLASCKLFELPEHLRGRSPLYLTDTTQECLLYRERSRWKMLVNSPKVVDAKGAAKASCPSGTWFS